jgi:hypothetical protein
VVWIQWFSFGSRGKGTKIKHYRKMKRGSELVLATWEVSMTRRGCVATLARGEAALGRGKGEDDASWANGNLTAPKNKENSRG